MSILLLSSPLWRASRLICVAGLRSTLVIGSSVAATMAAARLVATVAPVSPLTTAHDTDWPPMNTLRTPLAVAVPVMAMDAMDATPAPGSSTATAHNSPNGSFARYALHMRASIEPTPNASFACEADDILVGTAAATEPVDRRWPRSNDF